MTMRESQRDALSITTTGENPMNHLFKSPLLLLFAAQTIAAAPLVQDGGFEAGFVSTYWAQTSTNFGSPICDDAGCGGVGPRTDTYWVWFGGISAAESGSVQQVGEITPGFNSLVFYVWWSSSVSSPPDPAATFNVKIDGNVVFSLTPATATDYNTGYTRVSVDVSSYADGGSHTLRFEESNVASSGATNVHVDDISLSDAIFTDDFE
jgi:hypothetical protein